MAIILLRSKHHDEIEDGGCGYEQGDFLSYSDGCGDLKMMMMMVVVILVMVVVHLMVIMMVMVRTRKCWWQTLTC